MLETIVVPALIEVVEIPFLRLKRKKQCHFFAEKIYEDDFNFFIYMKMTWMSDKYMAIISGTFEVLSRVNVFKKCMLYYYFPKYIRWCV